MAFSLVGSDWSIASESYIKIVKAEKTKGKTVTKAKKKFTGESLKIKQRLEKLFEYTKTVDTTQKGHKRNRRKIEAAVDWNKIAIMCLGRAQWKKTKLSNRNEYASLLREIISLSAYSRMLDFWQGAKYEFHKIQINSNIARVIVLFSKNDNEGNGDEYTFDYYLEKKKGQWFLYDLAYEELKYSETINDQIETFLEENSFAELLKRLHKRPDEVSENE
jgi:ABC-type transporter MlaC component